MKTLFDSDHIEIIELEEAKKEYPYLNWPKINNYSWNIDEHDVMAFDDFLKFKELYKRGIDIEDVDFSDIVLCSVCRKVLLPDDECYTDVKTGDYLCDEHSFLSEKDNMYHKNIF